jgi:hypothetical protein
LLGNGEPEARAALSLAVGAIGLMELLNDARALLLRNAWASIRHADVEDRL